MKSMTKKQHRGIIRKLIAGNENVKDLRCIQQIAELFRQEAETCEKGDTLAACDVVRLLLDLTDADLDSEAYAALYGILGRRGTDTVDDIIDVLEELDERRLRLVLAHARALAGKQKPLHNQ